TPYVEKDHIRSQSLKSSTIDPIRTVALPLQPSNQESGYECCDVAGSEKIGRRLISDARRTTAGKRGAGRCGASVFPHETGRDSPSGTGPSRLPCRSTSRR